MYMNIDDARRREHRRPRPGPRLQRRRLVRHPREAGGRSCSPAQVVIYHAWENHQFQDWMQSQVAVPSPWKPLHLAGGYGHIRYRMFFAAPSHGPRGTTVEVERA